MVKIHEGKSNARGKTIAIVVSKFNEIVTKRLLDGCLRELKKNNISDEKIQIFWVPGAFELPVVALKLAQKKNVDAVICLGAVIKGETIHFDLVAEAAARGILEVSLKTHKPVIFGVLTTDTLNQVYKRSESKGENKGQDAALAALELADLLSQI